EMSPLATSPPNRLVTSRAAATRPCSGPRRAARREPAGPAPPGQGEQAVRPQRGDQHDDDAVDDQVDPAPGQRTGPEGGAHRLRERDEDQGADERGPEPPDPADDHGDGR